MRAAPGAPSRGSGGRPGTSPIDRRELRREPSPPAASDRRQGRAAWAKSTVWAILRNPIYRATLIYGKAQYSEVGKKSGKRRDVLEAGNPEERRAVVGAFLAGIRVEKATRQAVLSWYRLPRLPDVSPKLSWWS